jgi:hypothetical protein
VSATGRLSPAGDIPAGFFTAGIAYGHTPRGDRLYVANNLGGKSHPNVTDEDPPGHTVMVIDPATGKAHWEDDSACPSTRWMVFNEGTKATSPTGGARFRHRHGDAAARRHPAAQTGPLLADHPTGIGTR